MMMKASDKLTRVDARKLKLSGAKFGFRRHIITPGCGQFGSFISPLSALLPISLTFPLLCQHLLVAFYWKLIMVNNKEIFTYTLKRALIGSASIIASMVAVIWEKLEVYTVLIKVMNSSVVGKEFVNCQHVFHVILMIAAMLNHSTVCCQRNELWVAGSRLKLRAEALSHPINFF